jgi:hypothetical protein
MSGNADLSKVDDIDNKRFFPMLLEEYANSI